MTPKLTTIEQAKDQIIGEVGTERRDQYEELKNIKEFDIEMTVYNLSNKYTCDQINEMFIKWAESVDLYCGGIVKENTND